MDFIVKLVQLLLALSFLVAIHELGHYLTARFFGMRVEKFSIGFPPKVLSFKWGETEFSIGAIPLGGFVKISGMMDESFDDEQLKSEPKPWEYRSKPAWQRLIVMLGGIAMNIIAGVGIFWAFAYYYGDEYYSLDEVNKYGIYPSELGQEIGFKKGDKVVAVNGIKPERFNELLDPNVLLSDPEYTLNRDGEAIKIQLPADVLDRFNDSINYLFLPLMPFEVKDIMPSSGAEKAGLLPKDRIVGVDQQEIAYFQELRELLKRSADRKVELDVLRGDELLTLNAELDSNGIIGFSPQSLLEPSKQKYGFSESFKIGMGRSFGMINAQVKAYGKMGTGDLSVSKNLSGPLGVMKVFNEWNWRNFWFYTGLLSLILALMNLLPIPILDGGHVMFLLYEMVSGRPPSQKFLEVSLKIGLIILISLMLFVWTKDIVQGIQNGF